MKFRFQSFVDLKTDASSMQVIQWSVGGSEVIKRCAHLFGAYKYFKLGKISVKLVPASTLPVDPLQLSYDLDDPQSVDPRDQMNPGLVRITNGEDIFTDVSSLTAEQQEGMYNAMMLDPRWSKFMLQSGFRRSAYPLFWQVGQLHQDKYPGATINVPSNFVGLSAGTVSRHVYNTVSSDTNSGIGGTRGESESSARGLFQVGHRGKLGFLPTDFYQQIPIAGSDDRYTDAYGPNNVPEVSVITCVLPKAFKTLYFYRCYITEEVIFSGLRSAPAQYGVDGLNQPTYYYGIDQFVRSNVAGVEPGTKLSISTIPPGNNGDELP